MALSDELVLGVAREHEVHDIAVRVQPLFRTLLSGYARIEEREGVLLEVVTDYPAGSTLVDAVHVAGFLELFQEVQNRYRMLSVELMGAHLSVKIAPHSTYIALILRIIANVAVIQPVRVEVARLSVQLIRWNMYFEV